MDGLVGLLQGIVKHSFLIIMSMVVAVVLYSVLFFGDNSAIAQASNAMRVPMSNYYYQYVYKPAVDGDSGSDGQGGIVGSLGYQIDDSVTDLEDDYNNTDNASEGAADYSVDWF